jgi:hypothetical protein
MEFIFAVLDLPQGKMPMGLPIALKREHLTVMTQPDSFRSYVVSPKADGLRVYVGWYEKGFIVGRKGQMKE